MCSPGMTIALGALGRTGQWMSAFITIIAMPNAAVPSEPATRTGHGDPRRENAIQPSTASTTTPAQSAVQIA